MSQEPCRILDDDELERGQQPSRSSRSAFTFRRGLDTQTATGTPSFPDAFHTYRPGRNSFLFSRPGFPQSPQPTPLRTQDRTPAPVLTDVSGATPILERGALFSAVRTVFYNSNKSISSAPPSLEIPTATEEEADDDYQPRTPPYYDASGNYISNGWGE